MARVINKKAASGGTAKKPTVKVEYKQLSPTMGAKVVSKPRSKKY